MSDKNKSARVVVLISGGGTNLQALIDAQTSGELPIEIVAVISNKDNVGGLERAERHNISAIVIDHALFDSRDAFDARLTQIIDAQAPDYLVLAGFMRILTPAFTRHFAGRMINIHPSLLPKYQGLHTHRRAIEAGDTEAGATVHFVTEELDGGPPIVQARVPIVKEDNETTLAARVLKVEHQIFPLALRWLAEGRLTMENGRSVLDGNVLPDSGFTFSEGSKGHPAA